MSLNVLVVDDSGVARAMIIKTLSLAGVPLGQVHEATERPGGPGRAGEELGRLALVDVNMPVMNGEEMIDKLRSNPAWADLPVVVVSTEGSQTRIERLQKKLREVHPQALLAGDRP